ncbi:hypothetical protein [Nocardia sp. NPDC004260]
MPLKDANGERIGAVFTPDEERIREEFQPWARQETRQADTEVIPTQPVGPDEQWQDSPPEDAPWADAVRRSGRPPNYFMAHAAPDHAKISINTGSTLFPKWVDVKLNGSEFGRMLAAVKNSARAIRRNPAGEQVLIMCSSGAPNASTARMAAAHLHSTGTVTGNIHAPTDFVYTPTPDGDRMPTWLAVERPPPPRF